MNGRGGSRTGVPRLVLGASASGEGHSEPARTRRIRVGLAAVLLLATLGAAESVAAQGGRGGRPLQVRPQQPLGFGTLLPGVATNVPPTDPIRAAEFGLRGRGDSEVLLQLLLPTELTGPGGGAIPLWFGPTSAGWSDQADIGAQRFFDPNAPSLQVLPRRGRASVFLGGTAAPPSGLPAGDYAGTVTLQVSYVNN